MLPTQNKQLVKFNTPVTWEEKALVFELVNINDVTKRVQIKALGTELSIPPIETVSIDDVIVVKGKELIDSRLTIEKPNYSQITGIVTKVKERQMIVHLGNNINGVETTEYITIIDDYGKEHTGTLTRA